MMKQRTILWRCLPYLWLFCCLSTTMALAQPLGEEKGCIEVTRIKQPTLRVPGDETPARDRYWSDDKLKLVHDGPEIPRTRGGLKLGKEGEGYHLLAYNVWFRNTCSTSGHYVRPTVFLFADGKVVPAYSSHKDDRHWNAVSGPGLLNPFWLYIPTDKELQEETFYPEKEEYSMCGYEETRDGGFMLVLPGAPPLDCVILITASAYNPDASYRLGLSGVECESDYEYRRVDSRTSGSFDLWCGVPIKEDTTIKGYAYRFDMLPSPPPAEPYEP